MVNRHKNRYHGNKLRGNHTTFAEGMKKLVAILDKEAQVEGFTLGYIVTRPGKGSCGWLAVRIFQEDGSLLLKASKSSAFQEFRIFCRDSERLLTKLKGRFEAVGIVLKK